MDKTAFREALVAAAKALESEEDEAGRLEAARKTAEDAGVKRIEGLTGRAQTLWFWFLGILAFALLALFGLSDSDLFGKTAKLTLPVLNYEVALEFYLIAAPALVTLIYGYLHITLENLWGALDHQIEVADPCYPVIHRLPAFLVTEFALYVAGLVNGDKLKLVDTVYRTPLSGIGVLSNGLLVWLGGPLVVAAYWWRCHVLHDIALTTVQGLLLVVTLYVAWQSWVSMVSGMRLDQSRNAAIKEAVH